MPGAIRGLVQPIKPIALILVLCDSSVSVTYGLSFSPDFFLGDNSSRLEDLRASRRPTSIAQAILSLSQETWAAMAEQVFGIDPSQLDLSMILRKIEETNTCGNLDSPVEVWVDPEGDFSVLVYDQPG